MHRTYNIINTEYSNITIKWGKKNAYHQNGVMIKTAVRNVKLRETSKNNTC